MAEKLCLKMSAESETLLWTNPSPTAEMQSVDITLSEDSTNFKKLKISFRVSTTDSRIATCEYYLDSDFLSGSGYFKMSLEYTNSDSIRYARYLNMKSSTVVHIGNSTRVNGTGTLDTLMLPQNIWGIK